jgi:hypothetical protein
MPQKLSSFKNEIFINNFNSCFNFYGNVLGIAVLLQALLPKSTDPKIASENG